MRTIRFAFVAWFLVGVALLVTAPPAAAAEPVNLRVAYINAVGQLTPLIYELKGVLKHHGASYTVTSLQFQGTSPQIAAMAAGQLEVANLAFSSFANTVLNARLPIRIIADTARDGVEGHTSQTWYVPQDSPIKTVRDLKGKTVAINVLGAGIDLMLKVALKKNNLAPGRDVNIVEVAFPNMGPMLRQGKIDAGIIPISLFFREDSKGKLRQLFTGKDYVGQTEFLMSTVLDKTIKERPEALTDFLEDYLIGLRWFRDPANRDKALDLAARYTKAPRKAMEAWAFKPQFDFYRAPDGELDLPALQRSIDLLAEMQFIKESFEVNRYVDLSLLRKAQARAGVTKK
ncbi:MAG: ABC transporter substrate-binding protein [Candidatus Tectomicrobia bacterium]|nr:ABC transporter substrate-binding protein [Candidatus Tectomicrobia bacterium]